MMLKKPPQARSPSKTRERRRDPVRQAIETDGFSDDYLTSVIHDLRGSLNGIVGWAELLRRNALPGEGQVRAGEAIIRQSARQLELINEVGDVWRLLSGNLQLKLGPVDAKELVQEAVAAATRAVYWVLSL
jgi:K+-sensing histidine kinase KdpD